MATLRNKDREELIAAKLSSIDAVDAVVLTENTQDHLQVYAVMFDYDDDAIGLLLDAEDELSEMLGGVFVEIKASSHQGKVQPAKLIYGEVLFAKG
jgi:hypothetical protein